LLKPRRLRRGFAGITKERKMGIPTNTDRATWAKAAVDVFSTRCRLDGEETELVLSDLLCDLMHYADSVADEGVDFDRALNRASEHYQYETSE